jgi:hypothetical protein
MPPHSLDQLISQQPWERALFGTFALSLTFFESMLLRELRKSGCKEIVIVTDINGYRQSLMERRSRAIGQEYRLIPVSLPKGIFHPKFCYLQGERNDLLAIGSGNLTFGGFGRNLEVLDALYSDDNKQAFNDFAGFLNSLSGRRDFYAPERTWLETYAVRAQSFHQEQAEETVRLIHSAQSSVLAQAQEFLRDEVEVNKLTVLSPFHDTDGTSIRLLGEASRAKRIRVALSPASGTSAFPFGSASKWSIPVSAVMPQDVTGKRGLHAKWIEWETSQGIFTLTGSINATRPALRTTDNIELGVLRYVSGRRGWVKWNAAPIPKNIEKQDHLAGESSLGLIYAEADIAGNLSGSMLSRQPTGGTWKAQLQLPDGTVVEYEIDVDQSGTFNHRSSKLANLAFKSGIQIEMTLGEQKARGWVQSSDLLRMPRLMKLSLPSIIRFINREDTEEDDAALLEYFALHAAEHLGAFQMPIAVKNKTDDEHDEESLASISLDQIAPTTEAVDIQQKPISSTDKAWMVARIFNELRRRLIGNTYRSANARKHSSDDDDDDESKGKSNKRDRWLERPLEVFEKKIRELIDDPQLQEKPRTALLVLWLEVQLDMSTRESNDSNETVMFLYQWRRKVLSCSRATESMGPLEQHFIATTAVLASVPEAKANLALLHQDLDLFYHGGIDSDRVTENLIATDRIGFGGLLADFQKDTLSEALARVLATPTRRQQMQLIMDALENKATLPEISLWITTLGKALRQELDRGRSARLKQVGSSDTACPRCYVVFSEVTNQELIEHGAAECRSCRWFLLWTDL